MEPGVAFRAEINYLKGLCIIFMMPLFGSSATFFATDGMSRFHLTGAGCSCDFAVFLLPIHRRIIADLEPKKRLKKSLAHNSTCAIFPACKNQV